MLPSCDTAGRISIKCECDHCSIMGCCVTLSNSKGDLLFCNKTDRKGITVFPITYEDEYGIRVLTNSNYSPIAQTKWIYLKPPCKYECFFSFHKACYIESKGCITITLTDCNYPEYTLSKGEYSLWRTF